MSELRERVPELMGVPLVRDVCKRAQINEVFEHQADAKRFRAELRDRLARFALTLHPDKTRLIQFGRRAAEEREQAGLGKPATFNFLGFTRICGRSQRGRFLLFRRTRRDCKRAKVREIKEELRRRMHDPIPSQGQWLRQSPVRVRISSFMRPALKLCR